MADGIADLTPNRGEKERPDPGATQKQPPQTPPPIPYEFHKKEGRRWPVLLAYTLLALIVATGVVFGGRWVYQEVSNNDSDSNPKPAEIKKAPSSTTPEESAGQSTPPSNSPGVSPPPTTPPQSDTSTQLPVTGG